MKCLTLSSNFQIVRAVGHGMSAIHEFPGVSARSATEFEYGEWAREIPVNRLFHERRLRSVVLVSVEEVVVARVLLKRVHLDTVVLPKTSKTAAATRPICSSVSPRPLGR